MQNEIGSVYIICFAQPFKQARHYIGWTKCLDKRLYHHRAGTGARLLKAVGDAGISFAVVRVFKNSTRALERQIKKSKATRFYCPNCCAANGDNMRTPRGYTAPPEPKRRKYKAVKQSDGVLHVLTNNFPTVRELFAALEKRLRLGDRLRFDGKTFERVNRRQFKIAISEVVEQIQIPGLPVIEAAAGVSFPDGGQIIAARFGAFVATVSPPSAPSSYPSDDYEDIPF